MSATAAQRRYWLQVAALGCVVCGGPAEIAHCHGGSIVERLQEPKAKGKKLTRMNWLVLPICPYHHRTGAESLDVCQSCWELVHGTQASHIDKLCERFGLDLWTLARGSKQTIQVEKRA